MPKLGWCWPGLSLALLALNAFGDDPDPPPGPRSRPTDAPVRRAQAPVVAEPIPRSPTPGTNRVIPRPGNGAAASAAAAGPSTTATGGPSAANAPAPPLGSSPASEFARYFESQPSSPADSFFGGASPSQGAGGLVGIGQSGIPQMIGDQSPELVIRQAAPLAPPLRCPSRSRPRPCRGRRARGRSRSWDPR